MDKELENLLNQFKQFDIIVFKKIILDDPSSWNEISDFIKSEIKKYININKIKIDKKNFTIYLFLYLNNRNISCEIEIDKLLLEDNKYIIDNINYIKTNKPKNYDCSFMRYFCVK